MAAEQKSSAAELDEQAARCGHHYAGALHADVLNSQHIKHLQAE